MYNLISNLLDQIVENLEFELTVFLILTHIFVIIGTHLFKNMLSQRNFKNQQNLEHTMWIIKKLHSFAELYYAPITRKLFSAEHELHKAIITKDDKLIDLAYIKISELLKKYHEFEKKTGANILFIDRSEETIAIGKINSLFLSLPFDSEDLDNIFKKNDSRTQSSFKAWINSDRCDSSKKIVELRLCELRSLFDVQTEKILQPDDFLHSRKRDGIIYLIKKKWNCIFGKKEIKFDCSKKIAELRSLFDVQTEKILQPDDFLHSRKNNWRNIFRKNNWRNIFRKNNWRNIFRKKQIGSDTDKFYIHEIHPKYISNNDKIKIFGSGFKEKNLNFEVKINDQNLQKNISDNEVVEVTIPSTLSVGTYDITVKGTLDQKDIDEPMGLVVHVE